MTYDYITEALNRRNVGLEVGARLMPGGRYLLRRARCWLALHRFDIRAKVPHGTTSAGVKPMPRALLAERFGLVAHKDTKPVEAWALTVDSILC